MLSFCKSHIDSLTTAFPTSSKDYVALGFMQWQGDAQWKILGGRIDFCVESYWDIESSRIKYLHKDSRPQSHSDTILHDSCDGEKFKCEKRVYKRVIHLLF